MGLCRWHGGIICFCCAIFYNWFCEGEDMKSIEDIYQKAPLLQMGGKWQIITGSAIIRTLVERQALEELHEIIWSDLLLSIRGLRLIIELIKNTYGVDAITQ